MDRAIDKKVESARIETLMRNLYWEWNPAQIDNFELLPVVMKSAISPAYSMLTFGIGSLSWPFWKHWCMGAVVVNQKAHVKSVNGLHHHEKASRDLIEAFAVYESLVLENWTFSQSARDYMRLQWATHPNILRSWWQNQGRCTSLGAVVLRRYVRPGSLCWQSDLFKSLRIYLSALDMSACRDLPMTKILCARVRRLKFSKNVVQAILRGSACRWRI